MSKAHEIFDNNYSFKNPNQGKSDNISTFALMCWREAFKWGYEWKEKEADKEIKRLKQENYMLLRRVEKQEPEVFDSVRDLVDSIVKDEM